MFKTKGGGSKAFWTMFKKTADLAEVGSPNANDDGIDEEEEDEGGQYKEFG